MSFPGPHDTPTKRVQNNITARPLVLGQNRMDIGNAGQDTRLVDITSAHNNVQYERAHAYMDPMIFGPENVPPAPNAISNSGKEPSLSLVVTTPVHCRRIVNVADKGASVNDLDRNQRRNRIAGDLVGRVEYVPLETLNDSFNLLERYDSFEANSGNLFDDVARLAPEITATGLKYPSEKDDKR
ncbi:hypothetical protein H4R20_007201, partial [Coemansia guatemalensis]